MRQTVYLHAPDGRRIGTAEIDTADGEPRVLAADTGVLYVRAWGARTYVESIPVAILVKPEDP